MVSEEILKMTIARKKTVLFLTISALCLFDYTHANCFDQSYRCNDEDVKRLCKNSEEVQNDCPRSCNLCTPTDEDIILGDMLNEAKYENLKMFAATMLVIGVFLLGTFKVYNAPSICLSKGSMKGKTVVITGGTSGIGYETVFHLAKRGARVIMGCRDLKKGLKMAKRLREETKQKFIEVKILDLASLSSVREFAYDIIDEVERVDVLINNAGIISTKKRSVTNDNLEETFQVNYLSHFLLTSLLVEKLKLSAPSRVVNVVCEFQYGKLNFSDLQAKNQYSYMSAYYNSKLALLYFSHQLSELLANKGITVYAVNPGPSETYLWRNVFPYNYRITWLILLPWVYLFCLSPNFGAETTYFCALDKDLEKETGLFYKNCKRKDIGSFNSKTAEKLWEVSERLAKFYLNPPSGSSLNERTPRVTFDT